MSDLISGVTSAVTTNGSLNTLEFPVSRGGSRKYIRSAASGGLTKPHQRITIENAGISEVSETNETDVAALQANAKYFSDFYRDGGSDPYTNKRVRARTLVYPAREGSASGSVDGPATIRVWDGSKDLLPVYTKFILESSAEAHRERSQVVETFGDYYMFFFGESPPIYNYTGMLVNAKNVNWVYEWQYYYENYLRGTKCASRNTRVVLTYGSVQVEGYVISFSTQHNAQTPEGVPVQFSIIQTRRTDLNRPWDFFLFDEGVKVTEAPSATSAEGKGTSEGNVSSAYKATNEALNNSAAAGVAVPS